MRSYRTVSPLPSFRKAVCFLWHFPSRHRDRGLPGMPPVWSSDFPPRFLGTITWPARSRDQIYHGRPDRLCCGGSWLPWTPSAPNLERTPQSRFPSSEKYRIHSSTSTFPTASRPGRRRRPKRAKNSSGEQTFAPGVAATAREAAVGRHDDRLAGGRRALDLADDRVVRAAARGHADAQTPERRRPAPPPGRRRRSSPSRASGAADPAISGDEGGAVFRPMAGRSGAPGR